MLELLNFLNNVHPITPEVQHYLGTILRKKELRKNQLWLQEGAVCDKIAFINTGLVKVYFETGLKEVCLCYNKENEVIISAHSFFNQLPSHSAIRAVEQTTVHYITYNELQKAFGQHVDFNINVRRIWEHCYTIAETHVLLLLQSPRKRFEAIGKFYPWMVDKSRLTDKMLAAYLGITPVTLSNFRNH